MTDALGFKRASIFADLASAATVASVPLLYLAGVLTFWQLLVLVFVLSSVNTQGDTARYGLVPALARIGAMSIERANAADRAVVPIGSLVGPHLAGVLIARSILAGVFVEGMGLVPTILGMGAIYLAVTIGMFFNPALRLKGGGERA